MSVAEPNLIDFVAVEPNGTVLLVMVEGREWDGTDDRLFQLQEKVNTYASFALDGQLRNKYPDLAGKPICVELRCADLPDMKTSKFLDTIAQKLEDESLQFRIKKIAPTGS